MTETRYSTMDLTDCKSFYRETVVPAMKDDGLNPTVETPTYAWLNRQFPGFVKHLQRRFDLSPGQFYDEIGVPEAPIESGSFEFLADNTQQAVEEYLAELSTRRGRADATIDTRRSILRRYMKVYTNIHDTKDLLAPLENPDERVAEMDRVAATFDELDQLDEALTTLASRRKYVQDTRQFYKHLVMFGTAAYNPLADLEIRFGWDTTPSWDNQALDRDAVQRLYTAATELRDRFIVVACCGWGLRPSEVASLHIRQLNLDPDDDSHPYIEFGDGERKNGPGTVALLAGLETVERRIEALADPEWSGYLLPSSSATSGHLTAETVRRRFKSVAETAGITVDGTTPTPKTGRRFWYTTYGAAVRRVAERFEDVAAEQGSTSAQVVLDNYLSESEARSHRRAEMRETLAGLFTA
ncbi:tyrosine-type recombinase/integrase [Haloarcula rubripromontorii]|uniref:Tyrosine-type recombinase/integrase n=1 Tax=Haloarcula rubripromontorii TaxID=1705562 RepID=A0A847U5V5_9EURY|nr:tyrosine-type recombinase/integrase [Haloarcula rubripromontorii]NLV07996.1 tyrosine-type recombinase/integrase [Haloarcula rubripromontorii]